MNEIILPLSGGEARGAVVNLGPVNLVYAWKPGGVVGCGVLDTETLDRFGVAAANVSGVSTVEELLAGTVRRVNATAAARGVRVGQSGREALERM